MMISHLQLSQRRFRLFSVPGLVVVTILVICALFLSFGRAKAAALPSGQLPGRGIATGVGDQEAPEACYTLTLNPSPSYGGNILTYPPPNCNLGTQYLQGTEVTITASPNPGYLFSYWTGNASGTINPTVVVMNNYKSVTAVFTGASQCFTLYRGVSPTGAGYINYSPGPNCPNGTQYLPGTVVQLTAVPYTGYTFSYWSGAKSGSNNPVNLTMNSDRTVYANFVRKCYTLTLTINPAGGGGINANPAPNCNSGTQYLDGTSVQLTALPNTGYNFSSWTGSVGGSSNPILVTMSGNRSEQANFTQQCFTLAQVVSPAGTGSIAASPTPNCNSATQYSYGTLVSLTASPFQDYAFINWTGDVGGSANPVQVSMTAARTVFANFEHPAPVADWISPDKVITGSGQFVLSVSGSGFTTQSVIRWNGSSLTTGFVSSQMLEATVPAASITSPGLVGITVYTPSPGGGITTQLWLTVGTDNPTPVLASTDPIGLAPSGLDQQLKVIGHDFAPGAKFYWDGNLLATVFVKSTELQVTVPGTYLTVPGYKATVYVENIAPGGGSSGTMLVPVYYVSFMPAVSKK